MEMQHFVHILYTLSALDYDSSTTLYGIVLHVKDDSNTHTTSVAVSVSIAAINEATPAFGPVTTTLTLAESLAVTSQIVTKSATDSDASPHGITLYAINSGMYPSMVDYRLLLYRI